MSTETPISEEARKIGLNESGDSSASYGFHVQNVITERDQLRAENARLSRALETALTGDMLAVMHERDMARSTVAMLDAKLLECEARESAARVELAQMEEHWSRAKNAVVAVLRHNRELIDKIWNDHQS